MAEDQSHPTEFIAPSLEELAPLFPAYELEAFIAQGGMGAVYKARQKSLDRSVAIKILPREFGDDPQFRASFEAEAKAMARLNHPNLISVYDFGDIEGMLYIIMEFVQGKALYYSAHNKAIDPAVALDLVSTISRGLAHAHRGGIIHRDIKPANILLDTDAKPKIGDFGLAHPVDRGQNEGVVFGTPGYTAPEIFNASADVDQRSDIFSVGALLYELLCGRHPEANSYNMTTGIDPRIDAIVKKATNPDPNHRYPDVDKLADDLDGLIPQLSAPKFATQTPSAAARPLAPPQVLASSKKSGLVPFIVILLLLLGGAATFYFLNKEKESPQTDPPAGETSSANKNPKPNKQPKEKKRPRNKPRNGGRMADKDKPEPKKPAPKPIPTPTPEPTEVKESPAASLARLAEKLRTGERDEFPLGTIKTEKNAYFLLTQNMTWEEANNFAHQHGAHLALLTAPENLTWFHENFKSASPIWLGASDSGFESKWFWDDGSPIEPALWATSSPDNLITDNPNGENFVAISPSEPKIEDHHRLQKYPSLLEWKLDGSTPASLEAQLARTGEALNNKRVPTFPSGTYNVGGSRFLLVKKNVDWDAASIIATNSGGHLAVPSNEKEAAFIALTLKAALNDFESCWLGGQRDPALPEVWKYVTGETFTFVSWLEGQPDNFQELENHLTIRKEDNVLGANDEQSTGGDTDYFIIEWSVPALRNMPKASAKNLEDEKLLAALEELRDKIRKRHGNDYRRFRRKHDKVVEDFLKDAISAINNVERLAPPIKAAMVEEVKKYLEKNELPESLPRATPERLTRKLKEAQEEVKSLKEGYQDDFDEAMQDYLELLVKSGNEMLNEGQEAIGKTFILESSVTEGNNSRFDQIMDGQKVPLPEPPKEEEEEKEDAEE